MIWIVWAFLLVSHGAISRFAQTSRHLPLMAFCGDVLLVGIALITLAQLQGMSVADTLRIGVFFAAFGTSGRQLMHHVLGRFARSGPPTADRCS